MNHKGVCRTAPATPDLLMTEVFVEQPQLHPVCKKKSHKRKRSIKEEEKKKILNCANKSK